MNIVILDGHTTHPGDLDWAPLEALGDLSVFPRTAADEVMSRCTGAEVVLTNKCMLNAETIAALPDLRYIGVLATGYNIVDVEAARARGIPVTNVPGYSGGAVAQLVWAYILQFYQQVSPNADRVAAGEWQTCPDFCFWDQPLHEVEGKTLGIVGWGDIGRRVGTIACAFGMRLLVHTRTVPTEPVPGVEFVGLDQLLAESDVVSLHCPLTPETEQLIDAERIACMKDDAVLINTGRGPLLDESAVAESVRGGKFKGVGVDVLSVEPPREGNPLIGLPRVVITPHQGWATVEARRRLVDGAALNLQSFLNDAPINVVNS